MINVIDMCSPSDIWNHMCDFGNPVNLCFCVILTEILKIIISVCRNNIFQNDIVSALITSEVVKNNRHWFQFLNVQKVCSYRYNLNIHKTYI